MKKVLWLLVMVLLLALVACGGGPAGGPEEATDEPVEALADTGTSEESTDSGADSGEETAVSEPEDTGPQLASELAVYNWADYIDEELLTAYEEEYGVKLIYDTFASNEDLLAKLQAGATGYDVIFPSDYMVSQMIELGLLAEINTADFSNYGNLSSDFLDAPFDPGNKHCLPYQWGTTGLGFRAGNEYFEENYPDIDVQINIWTYTCHSRTF